MARFELTEIQKSNQPSSAKAELKSGMDQKIALASARSGVSEEIIRKQILDAKQRWIFGETKREHTDKLADQLKREAGELGLVGSYILEKPIAHDQNSHAVAVSPDGKRALVRGPSGQVDLWDIDSDRKVEIVAFQEDTLALRNSVSAVMAQK